jgi:hypothetical protein
MATTPAAPAEKKANPNLPKPKQNLLLIGIVLVVLGGTYFTWDAFIRPLTPDEIKEQKEEEQRQKDIERDNARSKRR